MELNAQQVDAYREEGYVFLPDLIPMSLVDDMRSSLEDAVDAELPGKVMEQDRETLRMIHGIHQSVPAFRQLARHASIIEPVRQFLGTEVYIHQFKVNFKAAFDGEVWQWHQDYVYLREDDGIREPHMANAIVFLDDVNEFNGPLLVIPKSHHEGNVSTLTVEQQHSAYQDSPNWIEAMTTRLKYTVARDEVARLVDKFGIVAPKGPAGSVLFFHPNCVHGSSTNMSPFGRKIIVINFNSTENLPVAPQTPRPEFLASSDYRPIVPQH
ncbi:MAG: phytanoyl-CoA dioxygenase family protein [Planctomycetota bacterium]